MGIIGNEIAYKLSKDARLVILTQEQINVENRKTAARSLQKFLFK